MGRRPTNGVGSVPEDPRSDPPGREETVNWTYEDQSYADEHALAQAILEKGQPAIVHLEPIILKVTWKESDQPEGEDYNYIIRSRTIKLAPSSADASGPDADRAAALVADLGVITGEHEVAYANLKPSSGEIVNQAQCERHLGDLLKSVHENVHRFQRGS
jgi:hypothetical protein